MSNLPDHLVSDIEKINGLDVIQNILEVVCRTTGMGFAAVARVTEDHWIACSVLDNIQFGIKHGGELKLETTICHEIRQSGKGVVIDHVTEDPIFFNHHTPALYGFQSYISMPIVKKDGSFFGTLCAIDPNPAKLNSPEIVSMFKLYADLISFHLAASEQLEYTEGKLLEEKETAELREQFIAILGHDLRNPVGAVLNVAQMMLRMPLDERMTRLANILLDSSYRMKGLIENVMDFAAGRLGGGLKLNIIPEGDLAKTFRHVINELQLIWPDKIIEADFNLTANVHCDNKRLAQLFSNLLGNALSYGQPETPVVVKAGTDADHFSLSVISYGKKISSAAMDKLFHPFSRGNFKSGPQGLGLGLYIAQEIARAHSGGITVNSNDEETCFTLTMPLNCSNVI